MAVEILAVHQMSFETVDNCQISVKILSTCQVHVEI